MDADILELKELNAAMDREALDVCSLIIGYSGRDVPIGHA
jgi:hypothetical protein